MPCRAAGSGAGLDQPGFQLGDATLEAGDIVRIPMKGATDSNPKPATFSGRKPTTHPHGYRQGQMYAHIVAAWVGASG